MHQMLSFSLIRTIVRPTDVATSRITDLAVGTGAFADVLYSTTRFDGQIDSWDIADTALTAQDSASFAIGPQAGNQPTLTFVGDHIVSGGGTGGALTLHGITPGGGFGTATALTQTTSLDSPFVQPVAVTLEDGTISVYAGLTTGSGIVQIILDSAGDVVSTPEITGTTDQIATIASATIDGTTFVFTASVNDQGLSAWGIQSNGALSLHDTLGTDTGLWATDPSALEPIRIGDQNYLILAGAGSSLFESDRDERHGEIDRCGSCH